MRAVISLLAAVVLVLTAVPQAYPMNWQDFTTVEDLVAARPDVIPTLMQTLNLNQPGLADVQQAWQTGDHVAAGQALLAYYQTADSGHWLRAAPQSSTISDDARAEADDVLNDIFHGFGDRGPIPRLDNGHLDWTHQGPNGDLQFACRVNRHGWLNNLLRAHDATGEQHYLARLNDALLDWLIAADGNASPEGFAPGRLEAALRMPTWTRIFYRLQHEPAFTPATRLLMLAALPAHAEYLQQSVVRRHNFATMQMNGLGTIALAFPEFKAANQWWQFARDAMVAEIDHQVYPDGAQFELTYGYHHVSLGRFEDLMETARHAGQPLGDAYRQGIERMWHYAAYALRPDGTGPLNADTDLRNFSKQIATAAEQFDRPDWRHIATAGIEGKAPDGPPSHFFPWAGQLVSRSAYDADAQWSFFDVGPYGVGGHGHPDKLHLSITAHGRHLLVDTGRFAYQGKIADKFRKPYMWHTRSHNAILIDGKSQVRGSQQAKRPIAANAFTVAEDHDWACGAMVDFEDLEGNAEHRRAVHYQRGQYWLVVDQIETDRPRTVEVLWHFHPRCTVVTDSLASHTTDPDQGNIRITPTTNINWQLSHLRGQEKPTLMGWYSEEYGSVEPTTVAVYKAQIPAGVTTFAWLITTGRDQAPQLSFDLHHIIRNAVTARLHREGQAPLEVTVAAQPVE